MITDEATSKTAEGTVLSVRIVPRASKDEVQGLLGAAVKIRLRAPPVEGKANRALLAFLSERLRVPLRRVVLLSGDKARAKRILILGAAEPDVREKLGLPAR